MDKRTCSVEGCGRPHKAYGWCRSHYARMQRHGDLAPDVPIFTSKRGDPCAVPDCTRVVAHLCWCKAHHNRYLRHGDVQAHIPVKDRTPRNPDGLCAVRGCDRSQRVRGWCTFHYGRWRATGDVQADVPHRVGRGYINPDGYRLIWHEGKQQPEHRVVMERILGRPLLPGENVHHKNGERADNRPKNLELWITKQPYGQRVGDVVAWAHEILARYEGVKFPSDSPRRGTSKGHRKSPPAAGQDSLFGLSATACPSPHSRPTSASSTVKEDASCPSSARTPSSSQPSSGSR